MRLNGKALDNCLITFLPESGQEPKGPHSTGLTDLHGSYRLRYDTQEDGAAIGWHRVTIQDLSVSSGVLRRDNGTVDASVKQDLPSPPARRSRLSEGYMSPKGTPLRKEVKPGHQVIDLDVR